MKLHELLAQYTWEEVVHTLKMLHNPSHIKEASYKKAISILKRNKWGESEFRIAVGKMQDDEDEPRINEEGCLWDIYNVSGIRDNDETIYSLVAAPWREWLGMEIEEETLLEHEPLIVLAECVYEMTWFGYSERQRKRVLNERSKRKKQ